ncbi:sigma factor-like helix-turn-helix DNA-binding protein [Lacrimispora celerecrescens]|uniref:Sigma-70-like protein n=1 Tax=[Clostridium] celerecrescens 18A TaxID=1286362 RepID=A0A2M8Z2Y9_9FIRM|nr:sigma-70 region 4 domain-containing protein [Lacrimispora celerecrescens]PJJ27803.1 sigma-70-like protein [[Clostridium] celerecrescens 18A]
MKLTREYLATYTYLESEIKRLRRRIKYYESNPLTSEYGIVKGSLQQFPYTECHFVVSGANVKSNEEREKAVRQLLIDLKGNEQLFEDMKLEIECFLEKLGPEQLEMKQILYFRYVERWSYDEIARELNYDRTTVQKKIDRLLDLM